MLAARPTGRGSEQRLRSNSFHFVATRDVARAAGEACPIARAGRPYPRARSLFLRLRGRMRLYETATRDFDDQEIEAVKNRFGQVYADVSKKLLADDFATDLRKLIPSAECRSCAHKPHCGGAFEPQARNVFAEHAEHMAARLSGLNGRVLDIGAGSGPYAAAFAGAVQQGSLQYTAVDPDPARLELLRARLTSGAYHAQTFEAFAQGGAPSAQFDHVLMLRSYNHLKDPGVGLSLATRQLRPGGTLLVADGVAFALLRDRDQAARAEAGPGVFEHYSNDDAESAHAHTAGLPLELLERWDVTPNTGNEWLLCYRKLPESQTGPE